MEMRGLMNAPAASALGSGFVRFRASLNRGDWISIGSMYGFIILLHVIGFGVLLAFVVPKGYSLGSTGIYGTLFKTPLI